MQLTLALETEADTRRLGEDLALALRPGDVLALSGDLGAGKSTLARALIRALAGEPDLEVPSPTFTLVQSYALRLPVAHFDFYRLSDISELEELGFDEVLEDGIALIEWPERMPEALPAGRIWLSLVHDGDGRQATISAEGAVAGRIARSLDIRAFLGRHGLPDAARRYLTGDASVRAYEYLPRADGGRLILMDWPRPPKGPPVHEGKPYADVAHIAQDAYPFIAIDEALSARGFAVPSIHAADCQHGFMILGDLGDEGVLDADGAPIEARYRAAAETLAALHGAPFPRDIAIRLEGAGGHVHRIPDFDPTAMTMEARLLLDWYLPWKLGREATSGERQAYLQIWAGLIASLADGEKNLLLRDFHSPNIIWRPQAEGTDRIGIIDFQDSMIGPTAYDVASLIQDARVTIPASLAEALLEAYLGLRRREPAFDEARFRRDLALMSAQRNCKLAGLWVRLMKRDGKAGYMKHMPRTLDYLSHALAHPALAPLREWCVEVRMGLFES